MCHNCSDEIAGHAIRAIFLLAGLLLLCTSMNEAKKLTEATEENCEGSQFN